jgi:Asp-tRNA(Asn)/Glu-tRNA(Gln) amidotransferase B subunit
MFFNNYQPGIIKEQEALAKKYSAEVISRLEFLKQEAYRLGNDSGEVSEIGELIEKLKKGEISEKKAQEGASRILHRKEAAIDTQGKNPNMGGH